MTFNGWTTCQGIVQAFQEGKVQRPGDLAAIKTLVKQANPTQKKFLFDQLQPYLTDKGRKVIFSHYRKPQKMGAVG